MRVLASKQTPQFGFVIDEADRVGPPMMGVSERFTPAKEKPVA